MQTNSLPSSPDARLRDVQVRCRVCRWTGKCSSTEVIRRLRQGRAMCCARPMDLLIPSALASHSCHN